MCSVTFWPSANGYLLGMNRDERLTRAAGRPPTRSTVGGRGVAHPSEPGGGTWISLNELGVTFALINWYAIPAAQVPWRISRGEVVWALRDCGSPAEAARRLESLELPRVHPFRCIGVFPALKVACEWRWDQAALDRQDGSWAPRQWHSSGHDEPTAQRVRSATFDAWRSRPDAGQVEWLRRLHGSHEPEQGPYSICMHRSDAATVSYSEVEVAGTLRILRYGDGPPCRSAGRTPVLAEVSIGWSSRSRPVPGAVDHS